VRSSSGGRDDEAMVETSSGVMSFIFLTLRTPVQLGADLMPLGWAVEALLLLAIALGSDERLRIGRWIVLVMATSVQLVEIAAGPSDRFRDWVRADDPVARHL